MKKYLYLSIFVFLGLVSIGLLAQEEYIYGTVTDKDDKPLANVEVKNRYSGNFTTTNVHGNYRLYLKAKRIQLVEFSIEKEETQIEEFYLRKGDKREINIIFWGSEGDKKIIGCTFPRRKFMKLRGKKVSTNIIPMIAEIIPFERHELLTERE
ncbi:MAG: carboxypeptidase-like regulatory domain-containing protein [Chitinophagales bacterium]